MYEPCWECRQRYGRDYSKECDDLCGYAAEVNSLKQRIDKLHDELKKAYNVIGELVEKPNPFSVDSTQQYTIAYLCDGKACKGCVAGDSLNCHHTLDIRHALDFEEVEPGKFMQKETCE